MTFTRAFIIAVMTELLMRGDGGLLHHFAVLAVGWSADTFWFRSTWFVAVSLAGFFYILWRRP